jgi:hypothetical protein
MEALSRRSAHTATLGSERLGRRHASQKECFFILAKFSVPSIFIQQKRNRQFELERSFFLHRRTVNVQTTSDKPAAWPILLVPARHKDCALCSYFQYLKETTP